MPLIDRNNPTPFYQQVYEQIAKGIETGVYPAGNKLPSIRECARELDVSNTTIELAYQKLTEQGYVQARRGSGYTICEIESALAAPTERFGEEYRRALEKLRRAVSADPYELGEAQNPDAPPKAPDYDFAYDSVDPALFPTTSWARISREVFFDKNAEQACLYNEPQGLQELREQIARYARNEFGLVCTAEQILVMPTTRELISSITSLFDPASTPVAIENPGYDEVSRKLSKNGFGIMPIPTYPYPDWQELLSCIDGARIVFTTPACQFPTNNIMPEEMRRKLVEWAQASDAYLIDDEYGWEFQSSVARPPSLAALDSVGRVITVGTFSNSFTPAVCLSYAILPPQLMLEWRHEHRDAHPQAPWQTQKAMATFMREDHYRTHIRKMRLAMQRKREKMLDAFATHMGSQIDLVSGPSSLYVIVRTKDGRSESELIESAARSSIAVYPTSRYWSGEVPSTWRYVLVGYAGIAEGKIELGIEALARAWGFLGE